MDPEGRTHTSDDLLTVHHETDDHMQAQRRAPRSGPDCIVFFILFKFLHVFEIIRGVLEGRGGAGPY